MEEEILDFGQEEWVGSDRGREQPMALLSSLGQVRQMSEHSCF